MLVKHVMTTNPVCCTAETKLDAVAKLMLERDCGEIPVCDGMKLVGVITDRDIACRGFASGGNPLDIRAGDVMTKTVLTIAAEDTIGVAVDEMEKYQVRRLPVVDHRGNVIGIVSQADIAAQVPPVKAAELLKAISKNLASAAASPLYS